MGVDSSAVVAAMLNSHCISLLVVLSLACVVSGFLCSWTAVAYSKAAEPSVLGCAWCLGGCGL